MPDSDPRDDQSLIDAACRGDAAAFETLYRRYRDWVARLALRFTGHRDDALDVLQETFIYLLRKLSTLHLTARMTTFLYPAVKNLSLGLIRKRRPDSSDPERLSDIPAPPAQGVGASRAELADVLACLPDAHREVVLMRFVDDMSLQEIAEALGVPLGTIKSRLHNALASLRSDERTRRYFAQ